jgi:hypothetical protein
MKLEEYKMAKKFQILTLEPEQRDFILKYISYGLMDDIAKKLERAKVGKYGFVNVRLNKGDLEDLAGMLALETNHNESRRISDMAGEIADIVEGLIYLD